jgi:hypothetical protein
VPNPIAAGKAFTSQGISLFMLLWTGEEGMTDANNKKNNEITIFIGGSHS